MDIFVLMFMKILMSSCEVLQLPLQSTIDDIQNVRSIISLGVVVTTVL